MTVNQVQSSTGAQLPASTQNQLNGNSFISLLTAQLQAQDPMSPMDPTQFTDQLVQFNMLQQMIDINQTLQSALTPQSTTSGGSTNQSTTPIVPTGGN